MRTRPFQPVLCYESRDMRLAREYDRKQMRITVYLALTLVVLIAALIREILCN